jgi:hypothetical protein
MPEATEKLEVTREGRRRAAKPLTIRNKSNNHPVFILHEIESNQRYQNSPFTT